MSEEYLRYRILENRVKEHSSDFVRWLNKIHSISVEEMISVGFDRDRYRGLTFEVMDKLMKNVKPFWKTAGFWNER